MNYGMKQLVDSISTVRKNNERGKEGESLLLTEKGVANAYVC